jgi:signal transduction histidine kinase
MTAINYNLFFATSAFVSGLVLIPLLLSNHIRQIGIKRIGLYTFGFFIATLAVCLYAGWFNNNPTIYSYSSIGNHLLTLGVAMQTLGIRKFYNQPSMRYLIVPCTVISEVLVFWFMWGNPNYPYRLMSFTSFLFVFVFIQFITVTRYGDKSFINRLLSTSLAIECLVYLIRFITLFIPSLVPAGPAGSSYIQIAYVFVFSAVMPITAICLMINGNYLLQQKTIVDTKVKNQQKTETLGFISHDLRAPLATISGYTELLLNDATEAQRKSLISIQNNIKYQLSLIDELQDYSKLELQPLALKSELTHLLPLLEDISEYATALCLRQKNCFHCQLPSRVPTLIDVDGNRLRQVLLNLLSNSAKFTHDGVVTLSVNLESNERGRYLHFAVSDTGIGIDLTSNIDIFGAFQQIQATSGSTGLGLFIAQRILSAMGSTLRVSSSVGKGSTFSFALPIPEIEDTESSWSVVPPSKTGYGDVLQDMDWSKQALPEDAALDELASLALHGRLTDIENWVEFHSQDPSCTPFTTLVRGMLENFDFSGIHTLALRVQERTQRQP